MLLGDPRFIIFETFNFSETEQMLDCLYPKTIASSSFFNTSTSANWIAASLAGVVLLSAGIVAMNRVISQVCRGQKDLPEFMVREGRIHGAVELSTYRVTFIIHIDSSTEQPLSIGNY